MVSYRIPGVVRLSETSVSFEKFLSVAEQSVANIYKGVDFLWTSFATSVASKLRKHPIGEEKTETWALGHGGKNRGANPGLSGSKV